MIGDWGLVIGDWEEFIITNVQYPQLKTAQTQILNLCSYRLLLLNGRGGIRTPDTVVRSHVL